MSKALPRRTLLLELRPQCFSPVLKRKPNFLQHNQFRHRRNKIMPPISAEYSSWSFNREDYRRVIVHSVRMMSQSPASGTILLIEDKYGSSLDVDDVDDPKGLMIQVGGDSLLGITFTTSDKEPERPMTLNLMNNILERIEELNPSEWHLLHVAVIDIRDNTFIGRLFFGNPETGEILWDCDCRPSDACWLSVKKLCPIYVRNSVWQTCAQSLQKVLIEAVDFRTSLENLVWITNEATKRKSEVSDPFTSIQYSKSTSFAFEVEQRQFLHYRETDPVVIKRLKREMSVAVMEEDYSTAARIRDHPYMKKYKSIVDLRKEGKFEEANQIENDLRQQISQDDKTE